MNGDISYHNATYRICVEIEFDLNAGFTVILMAVMAKQYLNWLRAYSAQGTFGVVVVLTAYPFSTVTSHF